MKSETFNPENLARPNVLRMKAYTSARDEFTGQASTLLDANENPFDDGLNRYPDPRQRALKAEIADWKGVSEDQIFLGNGSDEAIDLLYRVFCDPGKDAVLLTPPTYGMYKVCAALNDIEILEVPLDGNFQPETAEIIRTCQLEKPKMLFLCSPNNPTGNLIDPAAIETIMQQFSGIVVLDEAYIDFAPGKSFLPKLADYPNLVILQTFSKAMGLAGIRLGMAFASPEIIALLNKIKPPYNVNILTQQAALQQLKNRSETDLERNTLMDEREKLRIGLKQLPNVQHIYPSDANFLSVEFENPQEVYQLLMAQGIIVRDRSHEVKNTLRITIGTPAQNKNLLQILKNA